MSLHPKSTYLAPATATPDTSNPPITEGLSPSDTTPLIMVLLMYSNVDVLKGLFSRYPGNITGCGKIDEIQA